MLKIFLLIGSHDWKSLEIAVVDYGTLNTIEMNL